MRVALLALLVVACSDPMDPWVERETIICTATLNENGFPVDVCERVRCEYRGGEVRNCVRMPL